jgi:hypothetical protein
VSYVGRSDTDLKDGLKRKVGKYRKFKFKYTKLQKAAF